MAKVLKISLVTYHTPRTASSKMWSKVISAPAIPRAASLVQLVAPFRMARRRYLSLGNAPAAANRLPLGAVCNVLEYPHPILTRRSPVSNDPAAPALLAAVADLLATVKTHNAMGLAAPQIGHSERAFVVLQPLARNETEARARMQRRGGGRRGKALDVAQGGSSSNDFIACINPVITSRKSDVTEFVIEACLSFNEAVLVRRYMDITVGYIDGVSGEPVEERLSGLPAVVFQHELDHLDGVLLCDREVKTFLRRSREQEFDAAQDRYMLGLLRHYGIMPGDGAFADQ